MTNGKRGKTASKGRPADHDKKQISQQAQGTPQASALQQKCLNLFRDAFRPDPNDTTTLQEVKGHLYNRDFASAFGKKDYLDIYASRWSPSRALGYHQIFTDLQDHVHPGLTASPDVTKDSSDAEYRVVCLGGGAGAEIAALAIWWSTVLETSPAATIATTYIDIADWSQIVEDLHERVVNPPEVSKYASDAVKEANAALLPATSFKACFLQHDLLNPERQHLTQKLQQARLVTLMFTLNELYSVSMPRTQQFLSFLTSTMEPGSLLLVVDSPGSYSTISINGTEKKYPMQWLLDHNLIGSAAKSATPVVHWEKLVSDDSRWFRLPVGLRYPLDLENMRYQIHLYRRLPT